MVKKTQSKEASQRRWRAGRLSMRAHTDLKRALEFLAEADKRTVSKYVEIVLLAHVQGLLKNQFDSSGALASGNRNEPFVLRELQRRQLT
jgi:hypothetical protein